MANISLARSLNPATFVSWWLSELAALVPDSLRRGFRRRRSELLLAHEGQDVFAWQRSGSQLREIGHLDTARGSDKDRRQFDRAMSRAAKGTTETILQLPASMALRRRLEMPWVADSDLRNALFFEIDRQTPFRPDETFFRYEVVERFGDEKRLAVDLTIVPRKSAEEGLAVFKSWPLTVTAVEVASEDEGPAAHIDLRDEDGRGRGRGSWYVVNWLLGICAVGLMAAALYLPLEARQSANEALKSELKAARARADAAMEMQTKLDQFLKTERSLQTRKLQAPSAVAILDELTRLLPDDTWLSSLQLEGTEVRLTGYAPTAASLVGVLDASDKFATPKFQSPVTQDSRSGKERFSLSFDLEATGEAK